MAMTTPIMTVKDRTDPDPQARILDKRSQSEVIRAMSQQLAGSRSTQKADAADSQTHLLEYRG